LNDNFFSIALLTFAFGLGEELGRGILGLDVRVVFFIFTWKWHKHQKRVDGGGRSVVADVGHWHDPRQVIFAGDGAQFLAAEPFG